MNNEGQDKNKNGNYSKIFLSDLKSSFTPRSKKLIILVFAIFIIGSLLIYAFPTPEPDNPHEVKKDNYKILHLFEIGAITALVLSIFHAMKHWKRQEVFIFFVSCFLYALLFEDMNITLTSDYSYNKEAWLVFHETMLAIIFGWCGIAYAVVITIEKNPTINSWNPIEKGIIAGLLALTIDLGIDATAYAYGLWFWTEGFFFGVPIVNFVGWFGAVFWFVSSTEYLRKKGKEWNINKQLTARVLTIFPNYMGLIIMITFAFTLLSILEIR